MKQSGEGVNTKNNNNNKNQFELFGTPNNGTSSLDSFSSGLNLVSPDHGLMALRFRGHGALRFPHMAPSCLM